MADLTVPIPRLPGFDDGALTALAGFLAEKKIPAGEAVFAEGDPGLEMYLVAKGAIRVMKKISPEVERCLLTLRPGGVFGELALVTSEARSGAAVAIEDSIMLCLNRQRWREMSETAPEIYQKLQGYVLEVVARRLRDTTEMYRQSVEWCLSVSGAVELNFDRLIADSASIEVSTDDGQRFDGILVKADRLDGGFELWLSGADGMLTVIPYHAVSSMRFLKPE